MQQYLRKIKLTAKGSGGGSLSINEGGLNAHDLRISFSVSKGLSSTQNTAEIKIWNLSEKHRNALGKELDDITLEAGYTPPTGGSNVGIIFKGQMRDVEHSIEGPDIITTLSCGDGDKAFRKATISKTYKKGTEVKEVVNDISKELEKQGVTRGEIKLPEDTPKFKRPYTVCGGCKTEMDTLSRGKDFHWSIQNGTLEVVPGDGYVGTVVMLSDESGLIGPPTITDTGVKAKALLNPEIRPNRRVKIQSKVLEMNAEDSMYRVATCDYAGDNYGSDFTVSITGESVKSGKVDEGVWRDKGKGKVK